MSEPRAIYRTERTQATELVELRLVGTPLAVAALEQWLLERLEVQETRRFDSRKKPGQVLCYFVVRVG